MVKARSAGSFLGGIFNNPGVVILGALAIGLLFFQKDIRNAFGSLGAGLGDIKLPAITLPEFKFPEIKLPSIFGNGLEKPLKMVEDTGLLTSEELAKCECGSSIVQDAFGNVNQTCKPCQELQTTGVLPDEAFQPDSVGMNPALALEPSDAELFAKDFPEPFSPVIVSNLPSGFEVFQTPGSSFVGAQINPTPIENLSLSQIIDKFMVTASQAANIKAIAQDDFGDFDFGTNIGGNISALVGGSDVNVSSSEFEGLSPEEIANILTGGNIQNF